MNKMHFGKVDPEYLARRILAEEEIDVNKPINPYEIAEKLNIIVRKDFISQDILGACKAVGLKRMITINPNINHLGREKFTLAHEIGHITLRHRLRCCSENDLSWKGNTPSEEQDANLFASEILIPKKRIEPILRAKEATIDLAEELAEEYTLSVTAVGIKLVKLSPDPAVLLYIQNGKMKWFSFSQKHRFVELNHDVYCYDWDQMIGTKEYSATEFFMGVSENSTCFVDVKSYSSYRSHMCIIRFADEDYY